MHEQASASLPGHRGPCLESGSEEKCIFSYGFGFVPKQTWEQGFGTKKFIWEVTPGGGDGSRGKRQGRRKASAGPSIEQMTSGDSSAQPGESWETALPLRARGWGPCRRSHVSQACPTG